jgi:hypothetical protein
LLKGRGVAGREEGSKGIGEMSVSAIFRLKTANKKTGTTQVKNKASVIDGALLDARGLASVAVGGGGDASFSLTFESPLFLSDDSLFSIVVSIEFSWALLHC